MMLSAPSALAGKTLRLKYKTGDVFQVEVVQEQKQKISMGAQTQDIPVNLTMGMTWNVDNVNADGIIDMTQSIDRVQMKMTIPMQGEVTFDSAADGEPEGLAGMLAQGIKPMIGAKFKQKMNDRGEVLEFTVPDDVKEKLGASPMVGQLLSEDTLKETFSKTAPVLPEQEVEKGFSWDSTYSAPENPMLGVMSVTSKYTYVGEEKRDNKTFDKFTVTTTIGLKAAEGAPGGGAVSLGDQSSSGEVYFDAEAGYFVESTIGQKMEIKMEAQNVTVEISTKTTSKVTRK
jgi:hypothetical protein